MDGVDTIIELTEFNPEHHDGVGIDGSGGSRRADFAAQVLHIARELLDIDAEHADGICSGAAGAGDLESIDFGAEASDLGIDTAIGAQVGRCVDGGCDHNWGIGCCWGRRCHLDGAIGSGTRGRYGGGYIGCRRRWRQPTWFGCAGDGSVGRSFDRRLMCCRNVLAGCWCRSRAVWERIGCLGLDLRCANRARGVIQSDVGSRTGVIEGRIGSGGGLHDVVLGSAEVLPDAVGDFTEGGADVVYFGLELLLQLEEHFGIGRRIRPVPQADNRFAETAGEPGEAFGPEYDECQDDDKEKFTGANPEEVHTAYFRPRASCVNCTTFMRIDGVPTRKRPHCKKQWGRSRTDYLPFASM